MHEQLLKRVEALKDEFQTGQQMLRELETQQSLCRERLLRISGAIQVLEELLAQESAAGRGSDGLVVTSPDDR
jgi:predicted nuclease with TOPRIM domain